LLFALQQIVKATTKEEKAVQQSLLAQTIREIQRVTLLNWPEDLWAFDGQITAFPGNILPHGTPASKVDRYLWFLQVVSAMYAPMLISPTTTAEHPLGLRGKVHQHDLEPHVTVASILYVHQCAQLNHSGTNRRCPDVDGPCATCAKYVKDKGPMSGKMLENFLGRGSKKHRRELNPEYLPKATIPSSPDTPHPDRRPTVEELGGWPTDESLDTAFGPDPLDNFEVQNQYNSTEPLDTRLNACHTLLWMSNPEELGHQLAKQLEEGILPYTDSDPDKPASEESNEEKEEEAQGN
jgi:hypothetical protein